MSKQLINQYYNHLHSLRRSGLSNEMAIKQPFDTLLQQMAASKHYVYALEVTIKNEKGKNIRPDGILMNELRIHKGYVESKDTGDSIDEEINKKLYKDGYPNSNILFQDSEIAVLIQNGEEVLRVEMKEGEKLAAILKSFIEYKPKYLENFEEALNKFKEDIPTIVETLRSLIAEQNKTNTTYAKARDEFWEMCKQEINPAITIEDIREMVIQHILTEDLFKSVFDESDFHHENNIAHELEKLVNTFMNREVRQNQLGELGHYYKTLNAQASTVADHHEKQRFLKVVYENFYKVYNPKGADRLGVVYTPNEIVDFMIRSTDHLLEKHFGRNLHDENVHILDPATGTGTFITDIIEYIPQQYLEHKYKNEIHANEVAILPYYVANLNIEFTYKQKMGVYAEFPNICFVDTLDNTASLSWDRMGKDQGVQADLFGGVSHENAERIKRQNKQKISVVIGNPPYNANQANFNDFNKNREYPFVDKRIKETFVKHSTAQKTKVYDMYARFYRWAMDRVDENGVVSFITNRSFIDSRTFDGFRRCIQEDFDYCYIIDTKSDVRANPKIAGTTHNVFGIQTGVAMMFLVKTTPDPSFKRRGADRCQIYYNGEIEDGWRKEEKLEWIKNKQFSQLPFEHITPQKNNWINLTDNDWEELLPLADKQVKLGKGGKTVFHMYTNGVMSMRNEWVIDISKSDLLKKVDLFVKNYNSSVKSGQIKENIKWSESLDNFFNSKKKLEYKKDSVIEFLFRPFCKLFLFADKYIVDRLTHNHFQISGQTLDNENKVITITGHPSSSDFAPHASKLLVDRDFYHQRPQCLPFYRYDTKDNCVDNITDWGLEQFRSHYKSSPPDLGGVGRGGKIHNLQHLKTFRKKLRNNLTPAEATLWKALQRKQLDGRKFRRQHSVDNYILDFYCPSEKLAIELDGHGHSSASQMEYDEERTLFLNTYGIKVLRFENKLVFEHLEGVLESIRDEFGKITTPSPSLERRGVIEKEDIFHYTYGVLHNPAYRKKYELNLKRDFPRLPFYEDFHQWAAWGKTLMELHIDYEEAKPFAFTVIASETKQSPTNEKMASPTVRNDKRKLKVKLKADKEAGTIVLDEQTSLSGVPPEAWEYKLGNRSAIEWVLDQYKEKKPKDKTIAEKFNTYRFADYKDHVIDLLKKVTTVSVETMKIIKEMELLDTNKK